jgi:hypothetical protein
MARQAADDEPKTGTIRRLHRRIFAEAHKGHEGRSFKQEEMKETAKDFSLVDTRVRILCCLRLLLFKIRLCDLCDLL